MNSEQIEQEIQDKNLTAPRVTVDSIKQIIKKDHYHKFQGTTLTVCVLELVNGFTVTGESACVDPANFNVELGRKIAYDNAFNKIWELEGYLLQNQLFENTKVK